jgi:predicted GH43/DUF377 family glycosyl hydrolase
LQVSNIQFVIDSLNSLIVKLNFALNLKMRIPVSRKSLEYRPDSSRVVARYFMSGEERAAQLIDRIMEIPDQEVHLMLVKTLRQFARRHRNISEVLIRHCHNLDPIIKAQGFSLDSLSDERKMLIGSYFTKEFAIEAAAFFNPSVVEDPVQDDLEEGEKRIIISFRATGEGHISSLVFRRAVVDNQGNIEAMPVGNKVEQAKIIKQKLYNKVSFLEKLKEMEIPEKYLKIVTETLKDEFSYPELVNSIETVLANNHMSLDKRKAVERMAWLADSYHDIYFSFDTHITERVIFPVSDAESNGIEDARFTRFEEEGVYTYYAIYTAYNGRTILSKLLETKDFYRFHVRPLHGEGVQNKNLALFPRKVNGQYVMLARVDGVNNYIMYSDSINVWSDPQKIQEPKYPWEYIQVGNCGSPLETKEGWLVITHGVGPMRRYSIGATLLDLDDPSKMIGRLTEPLLVPLEEEREGYVPNVVYSCGAMIHNGLLFLPYAVSDYSSRFATVPLDALLQELKA